jgi:hypothetical protein
MNFSSWPDAEKRGVSAAFVVLIVGVFLSAIVTKVMAADSATFIALLVMAVIAYGVMSGKIQEFSAPGGWAAKFQQVAREKVKPATLTDCIQNIQVVQKGGMQALRAAGQQIEQGKPVALTLKLGQRNYSAAALKPYIETLQEADREMIVLFLDEDGKLVASADADTILNVLRKPGNGQQLIRAIAESSVARIRSFPGFHWEVITSDKSNAEALQMMRETNTKTMIVVDSQNRPIGVVKRDHIIARLLVELAHS